MLTFRVDTREEVDALYAELTGAGHEGRQPPFDAFFGARYAIVADPDGNDVGIMSPSDDTMRSWPPTSESPSP
ncbi:MAG TPA: VOC family protein [Acidimicrobiales bacterium]|nr:VOC family protein [Acidimicrobiales bacterium]